MDFARAGMMMTMLVVVAPCAHAWSDGGHEIIGDMSFRMLTTSTREKAVRYLRAIPTAEADLVAPTASAGDVGNIDAAVFARAATWPDIIREKTHPMHATDHHGPWHYINVPLTVSQDAPTSLPAPAETTYRAGATTAALAEMNSLQAIVHNTQILKDPTASDERKGIALAWVLHLGGDIHQPMHNATWFSASKPEGDKGGNTTFVREPSGAIEKLHSLWDGLLGRRLDHAKIRADSLAIATGPESTTETLGADRDSLNPVVWSDEGTTLARRFAYLIDDAGTTVGLTRGSAGPNKPGMVPADYIDNARAVARRRAALAGRRLALLLEDSMK